MLRKTTHMEKPKATIELQKLKSKRRPTNKNRTKAKNDYKKKKRSSVR